MPNWTNNHIVFIGSKKAVKAFMKKAKPQQDDKGNKVYALSSWLPIPKTFLEHDTTNYEKDMPSVAAYQQKKYGVVGWYQWRLLNYGCKWDSAFDSLEISEDGTKIDVQCDTPWSAPLAWCMTMADRNPELRIEIYSHYEDNANEGVIFEDGEYYDFDFSEIIENAKLYITHKIENDDGLTDKEKSIRKKMLESFFKHDCWEAELELTDEGLYDQFFDALEWMDEPDEEDS